MRMVPPPFAPFFAMVYSPFLFDTTARLCYHKRAQRCLDWSLGICVFAVQGWQPLGGSLLPKSDNVVGFAKCPNVWTFADICPNPEAIRDLNSVNASHLPCIPNSSALTNFKNVSAVGFAKIPSVLDFACGDPNPATLRDLKSVSAGRFAPHLKYVNVDAFANGPNSSVVPSCISQGRAGYLITSQKISIVKGRIGYFHLIML